MSAPIPAQDPRQPPTLSVNLSSNNPFRRNASPSARSPVSPPLNGSAFPDNGKPRPTSTNPFLDSYKSNTNTLPIRQSSSPPKNIGMAVTEWAHPKSGSINKTAEKMNGLTLSEKPIQSNESPFRNPPRVSTMPVASHRTRHSQEDDRKNRYDPRDRRRMEEFDVFGNPIKSENQRPRRNSESSVFESKEDERRMREQRHRERAARAKDGRKREGRSGKSSRPNQRVDIIDKLDVSSIYGATTFHHDGPFDACNPHRNRKGARGAPMQAFPAGSANNSLGGSGPVNKSLNFERIYGQGAEGFSDYNATPLNNNVNNDQSYGPNRRPYVARSNSDTMNFNPKDKTDLVHGDETAGLGSSTFLEGAPASRAALQRHEQETEASTSGGVSGGLTRKRSLAQKLRGYSRPRPNGENGRVTSPEGRSYMNGEASARSPTSPQYAPANAQSPSDRGQLTEINPFFADVSDKKDALVQVAPVESNSNGLGRSRTTSSPKGYNRVRTGSSPQRGILRNSTDENGEGSAKITGGGLLGRVKSLKGRGKRPERTVN